MRIATPDLVTNSYFPAVAAEELGLYREEGLEARTEPRITRCRMPIDYEKLMAMRIPSTEQTYGERDTMLYGLAVGMGTDPLDRRELAFVLEGGLRVVPAMATVLAWNDSWLYETGVDMVKQVHGEQRITLHARLPTAASARTGSRAAPSSAPSATTSPSACASRPCASPARSFRERRCALRCGATTGWCRTARARSSAM